MTHTDVRRQLWLHGKVTVFMRSIVYSLYLLLFVTRTEMHVLLTVQCRMLRVNAGLQI